MSSTFRFLGRVALVPTLAFSAIIATDVAGRVGAQGGPPCGGPASASPVCGGADIGSDAAPVQGAEAIDRIAGRLPDVALRNGIDPHVLGDVLSTDASAWIDGLDQLFYVEQVEGDAQAEPAATSASDYSGTLLEYASTTNAFALTSRASAPRKIVLDFDGHVTTGTSWNNSTRQTITSDEWDLDGTPGIVTDAEQQRIREIWASLSEDFAGFDVDVTTIDPGVEGLRKTASNDAAYGARVVISPSNWYSTSAGGVAYVGSFSWGSDTPAFVFTQQLGTSSYKSIAEAAAHEIGHTVGLSHDGSATSSYYSGHGTWAPIMGVGYYRATTQWSRGEYPGATNTEDDLTVMRSHIAGLPDDHADSPGAATQLAPATPVLGVIGQSTDNDLFQFTADAGMATVSLSTSAPASDLDAQVSVETPSGAVIATVDPTGTGTVTMTVTLAAGSYVVRVDGVGTGDPATGYSDYASTGRYTISANYSTPVTTPVTTQPPSTTTTTLAPATTTTTTTTTTLAPVTTTSTTTTTTVPRLPSVRIAGITLRPGSAARSVIADVTLVDDRGLPVAGATVTGTWSGQVKGSATATTGANGVASTQAAVARRSGKVMFTVNAVSVPSGYAWNGVTASASGKV